MANKLPLIAKSANPWKRPFELIAFLVMLASLTWCFMTRRSLKHVVAHAMSSRATLHDLGKALAAYKADFGVYPGESGPPLREDSIQYVRALRSPAQRFAAYYSFRPEDLNAAGEFLNFHGRPIYYTSPVDAPGPDGRHHPGLSYLLWTPGCGDGPDVEWEINNWLPR